MSESGRGRVRGSHDIPLTVTDLEHVNAALGHRVALHLAHARLLLLHQLQGDTAHAAMGFLKVWGK